MLLELVSHGLPSCSERNLVTVLKVHPILLNTIQKLFLDSVESVVLIRNTACIIHVLLLALITSLVQAEHYVHGTTALLKATQFLQQKFSSYQLA